MLPAVPAITHVPVCSSRFCLLANIDIKILRSTADYLGCKRAWVWMSIGRKVVDHVHLSLKLGVENLS